MRQTISALIATMAVAAASAAPAMACGFGYASPCVQSYVPVYWGCGGCGGWAAFERLPDPVQQYYYVNQGPTYTGPGNFAPYPTYQEGGVSGWGAYRHARYYGHYRYWGHRNIRYGYFAHRHYAGHYGYHGASHRDGSR